jgi:IS5 family transposase
MKTFKRSKAVGFFDEDFRLSKLTQLGDPLMRLSQGIDFEMFRAVLMEKLHVEPKGVGGRRPYDYVLLFKIIILQRYYNLSDDQAEYQICDRISFMRFLGLKLSDDVPDSKTIWHFRERVTDVGLAEVLFELFLKRLAELNLIVHEGKIVDASFVEVPRQRNSREENQAIKEGKVPGEWKGDPGKLAQKDVDARWAQKGGVSYYGYKNHIKIDSGSKLVTGFTVTAASVHDSKEGTGLLGAEDEGQPFYADSAYAGEALEKGYSDDKKVIPEVIEKGKKGTPLTDTQKESNRLKSKVRSRVEHVFGFVENSMNGSFIRCIGKRRAEAVIGLMNLTYNMFRKTQIA